jgi:hypothetical protein
MFKARSLSDLLGIGSLVPEDLLERVRNNEEHTRLLAKESELVQRIERQASDTRLHERVELDNVRLEMRKFPALSELLDLRMGKSASYVKSGVAFSILSEYCPHRLDLCGR